jgi:hypothetical protein
LATPAKRESIRSSLDPFIAHIRRFAREQSERLQQTASQRASELGAATPPKPKAAPNTISAEARRLIVRRKRFGPVTLDDLPVEQREGYPVFGDNPAP